MIIELKNVNKSFKKQSVLNNVNIGIEKGELVSLIGPSGCGKTTTLKMMNGLLKPTGGDVFINGRSILNDNMIELRRKMGYVIQQIGLFPHLTIKENIEIIPRLSGGKKDRIEETTLRLMELVNLDPDEYLWRYPSQLSGGQQQRIGVARAFAVEPEIILMDEPFSALDPVTREQLQDVVLKIQNRLHKTIVFVTHDMDEAVKLSDRICIMKDGEVIQYDTPEEILRNPVNEFVANFVGGNRIWSNPEFIKVSDIMIGNPVKAFYDISVAEVMSLMENKHTDSIFVVDEQNVLVGRIKSSEIKYCENKSDPIKKYIKKPEIIIHENDSLIELLKINRNSDMDSAPVLDEKERLKGLITNNSLIAALGSQFVDMEAGEYN